RSRAPAAARLRAQQIRRPSCVIPLVVLERLSRRCGGGGGMPSTGGMRFGGSGGQGWCPPRVGGCRCQQRPPPWVREHLPATRDHLMADELEVISDGEGIAIIGDSTAVDRFFAENDLESSPIDLARFLPSAS